MTSERWKKFLFKAMHSIFKSTINHSTSYQNSGLRASTSKQSREIFVGFPHLFSSSTFPALHLPIITNTCILFPGSFSRLTQGLSLQRLRPFYIFVYHHWLASCSMVALVSISLLFNLQHFMLYIASQLQHIANFSTLPVIVLSVLLLSLGFASYLLISLALCLMQPSIVQLLCCSLIGLFCHVLFMLL